MQMFRVVFVHLAGGLRQTADLRLFLLIAPRLFLFPPLLFHGVKTVIPAVKVRLAVAQFDNPPDRLIQKIAVMGDRQHSPPEAL